jgi:2-keto-4-pentenoate hydratase
MRRMTALHDDPRVRRGMERQLELRRSVLDDGARPLGWKLGLGTPAAMEKHGTTAPLVGFLVDRGLREGGSEVSIGDWQKPHAEPEVAVQVSADVPAGADREAVAAAIGGFAVAIELVDIGGGEVEDILAGNIFHRHVLLGGAVSVAPSELQGEIRVSDEVIAVDDPWALVGDPVSALAHLAEHLAAFGETLRAGSVLIMGSIVPAIPLAPGDRLRYRLDPAGELSVGFVE